MTNKITSLYKYITIRNNDFFEGNNTVLHLSKSNIDNYSLEELQTIVGGNIEIIPIGQGQLVINENGKLEGLEKNPTATTIWFNHYGQTDLIVGNAIYFLDQIPLKNLINYAFETSQGTRRNIGAINSMESKLNWELV